MPLVKAIESGIEQSEPAVETQWECAVQVRPTFSSLSDLERSAKEGDSPVGRGKRPSPGRESTVTWDGSRNVGGSPPNSKHVQSPIAYQYGDRKLKSTLNRG